MRLRYMIKILSENMEHLVIKGTGNNTNSGVLVSGITETVDALLNLKEIEVFKQTVEQAEAVTSIFKSRMEDILVTPSDWANFYNAVTIIKQNADVIIKASKQILESQPDNCISIKLPPLNSFAEIKKYLDLFDQAISQAVVHPGIDGKVEIKNVDSGSIWFNLDVGSMQAVGMIASLVYSAAVIRKKYYESELVKKFVELQQIKNEATVAIKDVLDATLTELYETEINNAIKNVDNSIDSDKGIDNEYKSRLRLSIKCFYELIDKGAEIHPALMAPEKVSKLFPDFKSLESIESRLLENKSNLPDDDTSENE